MKTLKRVILAINENDPCILVNDQIRRKSDYGIATKVRRETLTRLIDGGYITVTEGVIRLQPIAVVMMPKGEQVKWMTKHCVQ